MNRSAVEQLPQYLERLCDKSQLVADGWMLDSEDLRFYVGDIGTGSFRWAVFIVSVDDRLLPDGLFDAVVEMLHRVKHDVYVIGEPGSGAVDHRRGLDI